MSDWRADDWETLGRADPYYGVLSDPKFHAGALNDAARAEFFASGESEVQATLATARDLLGRRELRLNRVLDFGCGVGRLTIPLARAATRVLGVDASAGMIDEARRNCAAFGVSNADFLHSAAGVDAVDGHFDFVHSYIVLQHIPPEIGYPIIDGLVARVAPDGVGMLHFTFARRASALRRLAQKLRRSSRFVHRAANVAQGSPAAAPLIAMFEYDIGRVLATVQGAGFERIGGRLTDHGGHLGIVLFFAR